MSEKLTLAEKEAKNVWDHLSDFVKVWNKLKTGEWHWYKNSKCKYVELRIDMRTGHCIIRDREGNRINPEDLAYQIDADEARK